MSYGRIALRPRDLFLALLSAAAAAHTAFLIVLTWLRPDLGVGGIASLFLLPFIFMVLGFAPVIVVLAAIRIALLTFVPSTRERPLLVTALLAVTGIGIAACVALMTVGWLPNEEIFSSVLFGAAVGGVIAGLKVGGTGGDRERSPTRR